LLFQFPLDRILLITPAELPMASNFTENAWLQSDAPCLPVKARDDQVTSRIWFKSQPVDRNFCFRVTQLQLATDSKDQGWVNDKKAGSWTWFELVILQDETSNEPKRSKDGKELVWRSHSNRLGNDTVATRHFGAVFDRRSDLLANLEVRDDPFADREICLMMVQVGDILAVRVCARFPGWINYAKNGYIVARVLNEGMPLLIHPVHLRLLIAGSFRSLHSSSLDPQH
jgi:hypothetical protein